MIDLNDISLGRTILVTGGVGSIGKELVKKMLDDEETTVRVLDTNETGLFDLSQEIKNDRIRLFIGDIRDKDRLNRAFENVDVVFHAAALKHVPLCEYNPFEAVMTNIIGTQNVLSAALDNRVKKVIFISTDKAVNPTNVMGATKLLAERLTISTSHYRGFRDTIFCCVRFGNVLNSRGSVIPLFQQQIANGGPITVTHPEMTRFIMSIPNAVDLILKAAKISSGGEIFILKMPAVRIIDLAEVMIQKYAPLFGFDTNDIEIEIIGKRPGEKMHEELLTEYESEFTYENEEMFITYSPHYFSNKIQKNQNPEGFVKIRNNSYCSKGADLLSKSNIKK
ncbi:MAG: hypothetical protein APR54_04170, partial [Candidatus Cloacimonas sp. SDB]